MERPVAEGRGWAANRRSSARRIPTADVEAAVEGRIVAFLGASAEIDDVLGPHARDIDERRHLHQQAEVLASGWERQPALDKAKLISNLLAAVVLEEEATPTAPTPASA